MRSACGGCWRDCEPGESYELMCHPGLTPEEEDLRRWGYGHEMELQALTSPAVRADLERLGVELCTFKDLTQSYLCKGC